MKLPVIRLPTNGIAIKNVWIAILHLAPQILSVFRQKLSGSDGGM